MDHVWSFLLISGPGEAIVLYVTMFYTGWILDRAPCTKETSSDFLLNYGSR